MANFSGEISSTDCVFSKAITFTLAIKSTTKKLRSNTFILYLEWLGKAHGYKDKYKLKNIN